MGDKLKGTVLSGNEDSQKLVIQVNIPFPVLKRRKRFTQMDEPEMDIDDLSADSSNKYYQREVDAKRVSEISSYIRKTIINEYKGISAGTIFPTAMLLATTIEDSDYRIDQNLELELDEEGIELYIIDGQHRLSGMIHLYEKVINELKVHADDFEAKYVKAYLEKYKFNCSLMLNFDMWEQAQVFADVNFNQKKVSKNLYYTIYGMHYPETDADLKKNYIYIAHRLVLLLNSYEKSPLYHCIRMIGSSKSGLISQAFLADSLIRNIRYPSGIWNNVISEAKVRMRPIAVECMTFFAAVKEVFEDRWIKDGKHTSILTKTNGIGAMIRTMEYIHRNKLTENVLLSIQDVTEGYHSKAYFDAVCGYLAKIKENEPNIFSLDGEFAGSGGRGLENKLFIKLKQYL